MAFFQKIFAFLFRAFAKIYESCLRLNLLMKRGFENDRSQILIDFYTNAQVIAQVTLSELQKSSFTLEAGELLILIPFKDKWELTIKCLNALLKQTKIEGLALKTVLLNNMSIHQVTLNGLKSVVQDYPALNISVYNCNYSFNFSKMNNDGFKASASSDTKWIFFLNNDVELQASNTLSDMIQCLEQDSNSKAVGCTLQYSNLKVQHLFAAPGIKIIAAHPLKNSKPNQIHAWNKEKYRPVAAVTGAALMVRSYEFEKVGGFDENLPTMGQDIDLCLKLCAKNTRFYCTTLTPFGNLHHEGASKANRFYFDEIDYFYNKWENQNIGEAYYSSQFSRWSEQPFLKPSFEPKYPVHLIAFKESL